MDSQKVGFVTIGQSPRTDILEDIGPLLEPIGVLERGALDGLSRVELDALAPAPGEPAYVSRLRDGTQVLLSQDRLLPRLQQAIDWVVARGVGMVVVLCTGDFPTLRCSVPLLFPGRLLRSFVRTVLSSSEGVLGVLVPLPEQETAARQSWAALTPRVRTASFSPYVDSVRAPEACLALEGCSVVVMDCLGYTSRHEEAVRQLLGVPVVLARTVVARAVRRLGSSGGERDELEADH